MDDKDFSVQSRYEQNKKQKPIVAIVAFIVVMTGAVLFVQQLRRAEIEKQRTHANNLIESVSANLQAIFKEYFDFTTFLATYIQTDPRRVAQFDSLAKAIYENNPTINAVHLAPDGIVTHVYPRREADHDATNLFTDPIHRDDAQYSRLTKLTTITGPFDLLQGGMGFSVKTPIYIENDQAFPDFWGFASVTFSAFAIFSQSHLSDLDKENYEYQLKAINPSRARLEMIASSTTKDALENPVSYTFAMNNTAWTFYIAPKDGWVNKSMMVFELLLAFLISILVAFSINSLFSLIQREDTFKQLSYVDTLTKLNNSRKFYETLASLQKKGRPFAILYIDLNDFKPVNDTHGHKSGDELLAIVAKKITNCVRDGDGVFRIGGDEFTIIIPNAISVNGLANLTMRLKASISQECALENAKVVVGASIGYARCPDDAASYEEALLRAEEMMYADKKAQHAGR